MNYYNKIKENLLKSEIFDRVKNYSKDRNKVNVYFKTGKLLSKEGKEYGKNIIKRYSEKLMIEVDKKYNERNLRYMRQFYELFENQIWNMSCSKLSWSHYWYYSLYWQKSVTMEYALGGLSSNIFASTYTYYIPDRDELINEVEKVLNG